jgi:Tol biopolymer transport system component
VRVGRARIGVAVFVVLVLACAATAGSAKAKTRLVSVSSTEEKGNDGSGSPYLSANGRIVAFDSEATNLVANDANGYQDIFVRNRRNGTTRRVNVGMLGADANGSSYATGISADGRFVVYGSLASNLVLGDTNGFRDIFVYDRRARTTERVSISSTGTQGNENCFLGSISASGRFVVFDSDASSFVSGDTNNHADVFLRDRLKDRTRRISLGRGGTEANGDSFDATIADGGRYVVFLSDASNLTRGDDNGHRDAFVWDRKTGETRRVSVSSKGAGGNADAGFLPSISPDGRFVAFESSASNVVRGDKNGYADIFVRDREKKTTRRVSVTSIGLEADGESSDPRISADGRLVVFSSDATNLVGKDTNGVEDIFVRDRNAHRTRRVNISSTGAEADRLSALPVMTPSGRFVAFYSLAANLVANDLNADGDVFLRGPFR